ncbi:MAG TPA: hypothetical protein VJ770_13060 [Stellaceae bacterium]|nr:hypothetical protein [Stellaceae bacterium]
MRKIAARMMASPVSCRSMAAETGVRQTVITSAGRRLRKKGQTLVHAIIDSGMVVAKLLAAMRHPELVEPSREAARTVKQGEPTFAGLSRSLEPSGRAT